MDKFKIVLLIGLILYIGTNILDAQSINSITLELNHDNEFINLNDFLRNIQYIGDDKTGTLYVHGQIPGNIIYKFNLDGIKTKYAGKIELVNEGPNAVKSTIFGTFIAETGTVFIQTGIGIYKLDSKGNKILFEMNENWPAKGERFNAFLYIMPFSPGYTLSDKIIFSTSSSPNFEVSGIGQIVDTLTLKSRALIDMKEVNSKWYGQIGPMMYQYLCAAGNYIYLSLPFKNEIFKFNISGELIETITPQSAYSLNIAPLSNKQNNISDFKSYEHASFNGFFHALIFNKFTKEFYRITYTPNKNFKNLKDAYRNGLIEVFDEDFQKKGEMKITKKHIGLNIFTSPQGLCILDIEKYSRMDDEITFDCYKF